MRAEPGREIGIERGSPVAEYRGRKERRRPDVPGEFRQAPAVLDRELTASATSKPASARTCTSGRRFRGGTSTRPIMSVSIASGYGSRYRS